MTFHVERRPLPETETERNRARHAAAEAARVRAKLARRQPLASRLAGFAPRGFVSSNLNGDGRRAHAVATEKLRLSTASIDPSDRAQPAGAAKPHPQVDPRQIDLEEAIAAKIEVPATPPRGANQKQKFDRASAWHVRMFGWLGEIIDPVPPIFATVTKGAPLRPFKTGIHKELALRPGVTPARLKQWLTNWCNSNSYVEAMAAEHAWRHDLECRPVEPISEADRARALERLPELRKAVAEKIAMAKQSKAEQVAGLLEALGVADEPLAPEIAEPDPAAPYCWDCWEPSPDLENNICGACRAAASAHHADRSVEIAEDDPLIGAEVDPVTRPAAAEWYREHLAAAKVRHAETARQSGAAQHRSAA